MTAIEKTIKALRAAADALEQTGECPAWTVPQGCLPWTDEDCDTLLEAMHLAEGVLNPQNEEMPQYSAADTSWGVYVIVEQAVEKWSRHRCMGITLQDPRSEQ